MKNTASELMKNATPSTLRSIVCRRLAPSCAASAAAEKLSAATGHPPIGAVGILLVPERPATADWRQRPAEVLGGRRRGRVPLQRVGVPGVVARHRAVRQAADDIPEEDERAHG